MPILIKGSGGVQEALSPSCDIYSGDKDASATSITLTDSSGVSYIRSHSKIYAIHGWCYDGTLGIVATLAKADKNGISACTIYDNGGGNQYMRKGSLEITIGNGNITLSGTMLTGVAEVSAEVLYYTE